MALIKGKIKKKGIVPNNKLKIIKSKKKPVKPGIGKAAMMAQQMEQQMGGKPMMKKKNKKGGIKTSGKFGGKSNALGQGGRAAQLRAQGVPGGVIGNLARAAQAAPGQKNFHKGKKKNKKMDAEDRAEIKGGKKPSRAEERSEKGKKKGNSMSAGAKAYLKRVGGFK